MSRVIDQKVNQGEAWARDYRYTDCDGVAIPVTGHDIRVKIFKSVRSTTALLELSVGSGVTLGPDPEQFDTLATGTQTAALPCGCWRYVIQNITLDDLLLSGTLIVEGQAL